jgi:hypothetical protein
MGVWPQLLPPAMMTAASIVLASSSLQLLQM